MQSYSNQNQISLLITYSSIAFTQNVFIWIFICKTWWQKITILRSLFVVWCHTIGFGPWTTFWNFSISDKNQWISGDFFNYLIKPYPSLTFIMKSEGTILSSVIEASVVFKVTLNSLAPSMLVRNLGQKVYNGCWKLTFCGIFSYEILHFKIKLRYN